eukprot:TRINITY_DN2214_c0_g1_i1.p2 TRINITY_DN2214_c0_g1~~TRINITY_DN2214_c0_g1_i1.p2  ORF type:complete len:359 (-),score=96.59 TRINITY_DN2214_c0_g1_i1:326-1402(-)
MAYQQYSPANGFTSSATNGEGAGPAGAPLCELAFRSATTSLFSADALRLLVLSGVVAFFVVEWSEWGRWWFAAFAVDFCVLWPLVALFALCCYRGRVHFAVHVAYAVLRVLHVVPNVVLLVYFATQLYEFFARSNFNSMDGFSQMVLTLCVGIQSVLVGFYVLFGAYAVIAAAFCVAHRRDLGGIRMWKCAQEQACTLFSAAQQRVLTIAIHVHVWLWGGVLALPLLAFHLLTFLSPAFWFTVFALYGVLFLLVSILGAAVYKRPDLLSIAVGASLFEAAVLWGVTLPLMLTVLVEGRLASTGMALATFLLLLLAAYSVTFIVSRAAAMLLALQQLDAIVLQGKAPPSTQLYEMGDDR